MMAHTLTCTNTKTVMQAIVNNANADMFTHTIGNRSGYH